MIIGIFLAFALLMIVLVARYRAINQRNQAEIKNRLEAIHAAGRPTTAQDLAKLYPDPPPEQDAALLLAPALAILAVPEDSTNLLFFDLTLPRPGPLDQSVIAEGKRWLDQNRAAFDLIPWSKLEHAWIGSGYTNGLVTLTRAPLLKMSELIRLLCLNAILQAELQHPHEAMQSLQRASIVANTLKNDRPTHLGIKATRESSICLALERILNRVNPSEADLISFPSFLTITNIGATKEVMIIQLPTVLFIVDELQSAISDMKKDAPSGGRWLLTIFKGPMFHYRDEDLLHYLYWDEHCLAALDSPMSNAIATLRKLDDEREKASKTNSDSFLASFKEDRTSLITDEELRTARYLSIELKAVAHVRVAVTALAIERWRSAHGGQVPKSMAELVPTFLPAFPTDPFDDQPLRYKKQAKGYVIYSVGEDLTDDGGKVQVPGAAKSDHYDITFIVDK